MSRSKEILENGAAVRATFTPQPDSAPTRAYKYWVEQARYGEYPSNENFCHFWRVVVIWAPLWWVFNHTLNTRPVKAVFKAIGWLFKPLGKLNRMSPRTKAKVEKAVSWGLFGLLASAALIGLVIALMNEPLEVLIAFAIMAGVALMTGLLVWTLAKHEEKRLAKRAAEREAISKRWWEEFEKGNYDWRPEEFVKKRGLVKRFFQGLKEYCLVIVNVVRVNKWKICPLVKVPTS